MSALLEVAGLNVSFATRDSEVAAVRDLSFSLSPGEVLGIVGESGAGKTQAALALTNLLAENGRMSGSVRFDGEQLAGLTESAIADVSGARIAMSFEAEMAALKSRRPGEVLHRNGLLRRVFQQGTGGLMTAAVGAALHMIEGKRVLRNGSPVQRDARPEGMVAIPIRFGRNDVRYPLQYTVPVDRKHIDAVSAPY